MQPDWAAKHGPILISYDLPASIENMGMQFVPDYHAGVESPFISDQMNWQSGGRIGRAGRLTSKVDSWAFWVQNVQSIRLEKQNAEKAKSQAD